MSLAALNELYPKVLAEGNWLLDVVFYLIVIYEGAIQPHPLKLKV